MILSIIDKQPCFFGLSLFELPEQTVVCAPLNSFPHRGQYIVLSESVWPQYGQYIQAILCSFPHKILSALYEFKFHRTHHFLKRLKISPGIVLASRIKSLLFLPLIGFCLSSKFAITKSKISTIPAIIP